MRISILGGVTIGILVLTVTSVAFQENLPEKPILGGRLNKNKEWTENSTVTAKSDGLIAIKLEGDTNANQLALVDPKRKVISVYSVDRVSGEIKLKSVRKVEWDLQLDEFNGHKPSPRDVRSNVQKR
jgi:hypothetical protein